VRVSSSPADGDVVVGRFGLSRTGPVRTALDLVRRRPVDDGIVLLDELVVAGPADLADVRAAAAKLPRCRGSAVAREVTRLADGLAESPQETRLRLLLLRAGFPPPVAQFRAFDGAGLIGRVDFAYPEFKIAIEYDGLWHSEPGQFAKDRSRAQPAVRGRVARDLRDRARPAPAGPALCARGSRARALINSRSARASDRARTRWTGC
jgi:hypothetical protein